MPIASYKKQKAKTALLDTPNKNDTQQKKQPLMPFEYTGSLQKWRMTNTHLKQTNTTLTKMKPFKNGALCQNISKGHSPKAGLSDFLKGILKFVA